MAQRTHEPGPGEEVLAPRWREVPSLRVCADMIEFLVLAGQGRAKVEFQGSGACSGVPVGTLKYWGGELAIETENHAWFTVRNNI